MRILVSSRQAFLGGGETSLLYLIRGLSKRGCTFEIVCGNEGALPDALRAAGHGCLIRHFRGVEAFGPARFVKPSDFFWFHKLMRQGPFDLVHVNDFESLIYLGPVARRLGIPVVLTCHGWWIRSRPWQDLFFNRFTDRILAVSDAVAQGFLTVSKVPSNKVQVTHLGVDTNRFCPDTSDVVVRNELGIPPGNHVVSLVGRFQDVKGHLTFLSAARQLVGKDTNVTFLLVGESNPELQTEREHERRVRQVVEVDPLLRQSTVFLGFRKDMERVYRASDVIVCASDFESFGMAIIEAMSCARPVVSTDRGGPREIVVDGHTGFLVSPRDPHMMAGRIRVLLADGDLRSRMGLAGRARVIERFSLASYEDAMLDAYGQLVGRFKRSPDRSNPGFAL